MSEIGHTSSSFAGQDHARKEDVCADAETLSHRITRLEAEAAHMRDRLDEAMESLARASRENERLNRLVAERHEAEDTVQEAKTDFLAIMSHELRTPLNGILGMAELLSGTPLSEEQGDFVKTIQESGSTLLSIVQDVLDYSRLNSAPPTAEPQTIPLESLIENAAAPYFTAAYEKGLDAFVSVDPRLPASIRTDTDRLDKILQCLLSNAIKFTPQGEVTLAVRLIEGNDANNDGVRIEFRVSDTGIGIAPEHHAHIFELFYQIDSSNTRAFGGTGLGLALAENLARSLGSTIVLESSPGTGAAFAFTLHVGCTDGVPDQAVDAPGATLLAFTKHPAIRLRLDSLFSRCRVPIDIFQSPEAFIGAASNEANDRVYLLVDLPSEEVESVHLLSRLSAIQRIRPGLVIAAIRRPGQELPSTYRHRIATVVSYPLWSTGMHDAIRYMEAVAIERQREANPPLSDGGIGVPDGSAGGPTVLFVEDHALNQRIVRQMLRRLGVSADIVEDAEAAHEAMAEQSYAAVLIDVQLQSSDPLALAGSLGALGTGVPLIALGVTPALRRTAAFREAPFDGEVSPPLTLPALRGALSPHLLPR